MITILINTSDSFEDCWNPFFTLFDKYWKACPYPILLNTEKKDYINHNSKIKATKVDEFSLGKRLTWSECFIKALEKVETDIVLYFQEDYFIDREIDESFIVSQAQRMLDNPSITRIGLTTNDYRGKLSPTEFPELWEASTKSEYRICTQASLWRKEALLSYLRPEENGWMFEILGTIRSKKRKDERFLTLNRNTYSHSNQIVSYVHTGIIKGRWHPEIPKIFSDNAITTIDFNERGFYNINTPKWKSRMQVLKKLLAEPRLLIKSYLNR